MATITMGKPQNRSKMTDMLFYWILGVIIVVALVIAYSVLNRTVQNKTNTSLNSVTKTFTPPPVKITTDGLSTTMTLYNGAAISSQYMSYNPLKNVFTDKITPLNSSSVIGNGPLLLKTQSATSEEK
jgi:hypothetical protein